MPEATRATAMMDAAIASAKAHYTEVRSLLDSKGLTRMPIVIGETGWKADPSRGEFNRAHPVNQKMYLDRLNDWVDKTKNPAGPTAIFYFEAFDEPWKLSDALFAPTIVASTVTANRYTLYADTVTAGEVRVSGLQWFGWDSPPNAFAGESIGVAADGELFHFMEIGPSPNAANLYGWGMFTTYSASTDLSQFEASGKLNLRIKTLYPGKLQIGFLTGSGSTAYDVYLPISERNADGYGYINDGQWHNVSVPISAIKAAGAPSYGNSPSVAKFDLTKVTNPFVMTDIYGVTGNSAKGDKTKIYVDAVYWSK